METTPRPDGPMDPTDATEPIDATEPAHELDLERTDSTAPSAPSAPSAPEPYVRAEPVWITGPSPFTVLAGMFALAVAVLAFVLDTTDLVVDWPIAGPATVVAAGVVLAVFGLLGMRRRTR